MLGPHLRRLRGLVSQAALGDAIGCKQSNVSGIERGDQAISAALLARWLEATGATTEDSVEALRLAGLSEEMQPQPPAAA